MFFYVLCVIVNLVAVLIDCLNELFEKGEITMKKGILVMLVVLILAGFTGTIILIGLFMVNKVPRVTKKFDEEITLLKDDFFSNFG